MSNNQTLDRLLRSGTGLLNNPFFMHMSERAVGSVTFAAQHMPGGAGRNLFHYGPGWYNFGAFPHIETGDATAAARNAGPFMPNLTLNHHAGISMTVQGPANGGDIPGGVVQPIPYGKMLLGKRVRITGCAYVDDDGGGFDTCGISIWLKGRVRQQNIVEPAVPTDYSGTDGSVTAGSTSLTSLLGVEFQTVSVASGDLVMVEGQGVGEQRGLYQVDAVNDEDNLDIRPPQDNTGFHATGSGLRLVVATENEGEFVTAGHACARLSRTTHTVGLVVHCTPSGSNYGDPRMTFWRGWDFLQAPLLSGGATPDFVALMWGRYNTELDGIEQYTGITAGRHAFDSPEEMWFLDASTWSDDPLQGDIELLTSDTHAAGTLFYFDEIVEIPANLDSDVADLFLIALTKDPRTALNASTTQFQVSLLALNMELLPEDGSGGGGIEDRLARQFLQDGGGGPDWMRTTGGLFMHYLRWPIYHEVTYPITATRAVTAQWSGAAGWDDVTIDANGRFQIQGDGVWTANRFVWHMPQLPQGSHILRAAMYVDVFTTDGESFIANLRTLQSFHEASEGGGFLGEIIGELVPGYDVASGSSGFESIGFTNCLGSGNHKLPYRNRVGFIDSSDLRANDGAYPAAGDTILNMVVSGTPGVSFVYTLGTGYFIAWVDPRLPGYTVQFGAPDWT